MYKDSYKYPTEWSHFELYSSSLKFVGSSSMESLSTVSETLSQFRQLADGMTVICQDVNELKCEGTT